MVLPKTRYLAFSYHLFLSLFFFLVIFSTMYIFWFPGALFQASGGWEGIKIIAAVDIVLGPAITLIVYNTRKPQKELIRDLFIILVIQLSCLAYGVHVVHQSRPIAAVLVFDTFYTFKKQDYLDQGISQEKVKDLTTLTTKLFYVETSTDTDTFLMEHVKSLLGGTPLERDITRYKVIKATDIEKNSEGVFDNNHSCYLYDIETVYNTGRICFSPKTQRFVYFKTENNLIETEATPSAHGDTKK
ncbi:hypothetical protein [Teredinibacter sp. KSP-S5-2]|uniref:hypothetical protein n=1 Tax=Teredinibacter sp. KSP-S5-2 TaxID=3034506 RepID=UPI0029341BB8|nr:hypothetical protein [Teredinibacter sp. KSP-S5-2]WNO09634.1 hypothetical protein P5V12_00380 [Teredinibacter sp. KSP-S5-2]